MPSGTQVDFSFTAGANEVNFFCETIFMIKNQSYHSTFKKSHLNAKKYMFLTITNSNTHRYCCFLSEQVSCNVRRSLQYQ